MGVVLSQNKYTILESGISGLNFIWIFNFMVNVLWWTSNEHLNPVTNNWIWNSGPQSEQLVQPKEWTLDKNAFKDTLPTLHALMHDQMPPVEQYI